MCTCPNYMMFKGTHINRDMQEVPTYEFCGHHQYDRLMKSGVPYIQVPCGKCLECRLQQTRQWSDRCVLESKNSEYNYFVTLTYDDNHLPPHASLVPKDLEQFINLLRKYFKRKLKFEGKIRYLACGEYGGTTLRPHFHLILFNCPIPDVSQVFWLEEDGKLKMHLRPESKSKTLSHSMLIYDLWKRKGMISVDYFSYDTAAYVAQYVTKKVGNYHKDLWTKMNLVPEFMRMSNGIGKQYFVEHPDVHDLGKLVIDGNGEAHLASVPRYFDKLFIKKYGKDIFDGSVSSRRVKKRLSQVQLNLSSSVKYDKQCEVREHNIKKRHALKSQL